MAKQSQTERKGLETATNSNKEEIGPVETVLVVGSCGLDRLLTVPKFPSGDAKIRTTEYHEVGGGNAANTAHCMALLSQARIFQHSQAAPSRSPKLRIKLLTKLAPDPVGSQLVQELQDAGVDTSLIRFSGPGTTTSFTTVLVSHSEHTRCCVHTPGTCGELSPATLGGDEEGSGANSLGDWFDRVFEGNVVHLHSDCRHTDVALLLAEEARRRRIPVSVDAEKDRRTESQHRLLELATTLFTNSQQLRDYFETRKSVAAETGAPPSEMTKRESVKVETRGGMVTQLDHNIKSTIGASIQPSSFYLQWCGDTQLDKEVVITKGSMGALRVCPTSMTTNQRDSTDEVEEIVITSTASGDFTIDENNHEFSAKYSVSHTGVLPNVDIVDTTGAGDAFIGGYIIAQLVGNDDWDISTKLRFASWVGGKKLEGPGARSALPRAEIVDKELGETAESAKVRLKELIGSFGGMQDMETPPWLSA